MNFTRKYDRSVIARRTAALRFSIGLCVIGCALVSCIKPLSPEEVAEMTSGGYTVVATMPTTGEAQDVIAIDSCAYIAQGQGGIAIVNIKDPLHPKLLSEIISEMSPAYARKVAYAKDSAGTEAVYSALGPMGVATADVTDKLHPVVTRANNGFKTTISFFVYKNFLFSTASADGIFISDISDARYLNTIGNIQVPGYGKSVCLSSDTVYALLAIGEGGFMMLNFSQLLSGKNKLPDTLSGRLDLPGSAEYVAIIPGTKYACIACGPAGLQILDYSDTAHIKVAGSFATGGFAKDVCVEGNRAYLATELHGVQIIDISNVASPRRIGQMKFSNVRGIDVSNGYVYAADSTQGLVIMKIP